LTASDLPPPDTAPVGTPTRPFDLGWFDLAEPVVGTRWEVRHHDAEILDRWRSALEAGDGLEVDRIVSASRADRTRTSSRALHGSLLGRRRSDRMGDLDHGGGGPGRA
jgi:hypothetical protein